MPQMQNNWRTRELEEDGMNPEDWLDNLFEFENCGQCGGGPADHVVDLDCDGLFRATCLHPLPEDGL